MKVGVRLQAILRRYRPAGFQGDVVEVTLPDGATARDAAIALGVPTDMIHAVFVNDKQSALEIVLSEGDAVRLFPPVAGGCQQAAIPMAACRNERMRIFIAGIMQGSRRGNGIESQDYRERIASAIRARLPDADILDPWALHPDSVNYDDNQGRQVYLALNDMAASADVLVAYVPEASMGTAIEMWQAFKAGAHVFTISPLAENWVVKFLSQRVFATLDEFVQFVAHGEFEAAVTR
jgi:molybdopterin converting factor small subunit